VYKSANSTIDCRVLDVLVIRDEKIRHFLADCFAHIRENIFAHMLDPSGGHQRAVILADLIVQQSTVV
jgi:hypothetical protein